MTELYSVPFISNFIPSIESANQYPEIRFFLESMRMMGLKPNYIFVQNKERNSFSSLGYRADKHIASGIDFLRHIRLYPASIVHLQLNGHNDVSLASVLISSIASDNCQIYISGLNKLEQKKVSSALDLKFKILPEKFNEADCLDVLSNFTKHFYIEKFRQLLYSMPYLDRMKDTIMQILTKVSRKASKPFSIKLEHRFLVNVILVTEYWERYEKILQQIFSYLGQNGNQKNLYASRLVFLMLIPEFKIESIKRELHQVVDFESKDYLERVTKKNELVSFVASFLLNSKNDRMKDSVQDAIIRILFLYRIQSDHHSFKKVHFIDPVPSQQANLKNTLCGFTDKFLDQAISQNESKEDGSAVPDRAKRMYVNEIIRLVMHSQQLGFATRENRYEYTEFSKEVFNFLDHDNFYVDKLIINPVIQANKNFDFIVSKVLPQVKITVKEAKNIIDHILGYINPHVELLRQMIKIFESTQVGEKAKKLSDNIQEYIKLSVQILPKLDYVLIAGKNVAENERALYKDSKISLGMGVFQGDYEDVIDKKERMGYNNILTVGINGEHKLNANPKWLHSIYVNFVQHAVYKKLTEILKLDILKDESINKFDYFIQALQEQNIFLGYEQLKNILLRYKNWRLENVIDFGYVAQSYNGINYYDNILDFANWRSRDNKTKESLFGKHTILDDSKSLRGYLYFKFSSWQSIIDQFLSSNSNREVDHWLSSLFQALTFHNVFNIFSEEAKQILPINVWQTEIRVALQEHFKQNYQNLKSLPKYFLIKLTPEQSYVSFFCHNFSIEIGDSLIPIMFFVSASRNAPLTGNNWGWNDFIVNFSKKNKNAVSNLKTLWHSISSYSVIYMEFVHALALTMLNDVINRYLISSRHDVKILENYKRIDDKQKLVIYSLRSEDGEHLLNHRKNQDSLISLNIALDGFYTLDRAEIEKKHLSSMLKEINFQFSNIPYIKYAPYDLKLFRLNINKIQTLLEIKVTEITEEDIKELISITSKTWGLYAKLVEAESAYPYKYRYLNIAFNNSYSRSSSDDGRDLLLFLRNTSDFSNGTKASHGFLLNKLYESLAFKNLIVDKKYFFIYARQSNINELGYLLQSVRIFKGMSTQIYLDDTLDENVKKEVLYYLNPESIVRLRSK